MCYRSLHDTFALLTYLKLYIITDFPIKILSSAYYRSSQCDYHIPPWRPEIYEHLNHLRRSYNSQVRLIPSFEDPPATAA